MIQAKPSTQITVTADGFATNLVGILGYQIIDANTGTVHTGRTTDGIVEIAGLGVYTAQPITPSTAGSYLIVWDDTTTTATEDLVVATPYTPPVSGEPSAHPDWTPDVSEVGSLLRARTKSANADEIGTFDETTRPTGDEVNTLISQSASTMSTMMGDVIPEALWDDVRHMVALRAAMLVELSYYPEAVASDRSAYAEYKELWDEAIGTTDDPGWLVLAVRRAEDTGDVTIDEPGKPKYSFPKSRPLAW